jgi:hypothetical protein
MCLTLTQAETLAFDVPELPNKPTDFWGMKWGDAPDKLSADKIFIKENKEKNVETYDIQQDGLYFKDLSIVKVHYGFYYKQLVDIEITFSGNYSDNEILINMTQVFGKPLLFNEQSIKKYVWVDKELTIILRLSHNAASKLEFFNDQLFRKLFS